MQIVDQPFVPNLKDGDEACISDSSIHFRSVSASDQNARAARAFCLPSDAKYS